MSHFGSLEFEIQACLSIILRRKQGSLRSRLPVILTNLALLVAARSTPEEVA